MSFAPLPVFVRGGGTYSRIGPDFVIVHNGLLMVVEVDGDTVHQETPAEAHKRTTILLHEGAHFERILSSECDTPSGPQALQLAAGPIQQLRRQPPIAQLFGLSLAMAGEHARQRRQQSRQPFAVAVLMQQNPAHRHQRIIPAVRIRSGDASVR